MKIKISTAKNVTPMIYAYTTPEIARHDGWTKIGYTEQDVQTRIKQQTRTADIIFNLEWQGNAVYDDGSFETFSDRDFHAYLRKLGFKNNSEWFQVTGAESLQHFYKFRTNRGVLKNLLAIPYNLRGEQDIAVAATLKYFREHEGGEFPSRVSVKLWRLTTFASGRRCLTSLSSRIVPPLQIPGMMITLNFWAELIGFSSAKSPRLRIKNMF